MGYKKLRKKYKIRSPYIGRWLKWLKLKMKGQTWILLCLMLCGCVQVKLPDGTEYLRLGPQEIGEVLITFPDGTEFLMDSQKAEVPPVKIIIPGGIIIESGKVGP